MSFGSLIEVAFGLVAIYLALSIIVTAVNEWASSWTKLRAKTLRAALDGMIGEERRRSLYEHPLVKALGVAGPGDEPTWIPPDLFAGVHIEDWLSELQGADASITSVDAAIERVVEDGAGVEPLASLVRQGAEDMEALQADLERWFDVVMGAASAAYAARMRVYGFVVGLVVCVALNADTVEFVEAVWTDDAVQAAVTSWAEAQLAAGEPTTVSADVIDAVPLGWSRADVCAATGIACIAPATWGGIGATVSKLLGLLATALAVSLGAPFWFEVLSNINNLRKKSPTEGSKKA